MYNSIQEWEKAQDHAPITEMKIITSLLQDKFKGAEFSVDFDEDGLALRGNVHDEGNIALIFLTASLAMLGEALDDVEITESQLGAYTELIEGTNRALKEIMESIDQFPIKEKQELTGGSDVEKLLNALPESERANIAKQLLEKMFGK